MLFIDKSASNIIAAKTIHIKKVSCRIRRRIGGARCTDISCDICAVAPNVIPDVPPRLFQLLNDSIFLELIIGSLPQDLYIMSEMIWLELFPEFKWDILEEFLQARRKKEDKRDTFQRALVKRYDDTYKLFFKIVDYDNWFLNSANSNRYDAYHLALGLDRNTCTYCNRLYTNTVKTRKGEKVMRPTFDHWFSHARHPSLGLSFYNLIPSCSVCNSSVRGTKEYLLSTHLHPYLDMDSLDSFEYNYHYQKSTQQFDIFLKIRPNAPKVFRTLEDLKLKEIYNAHHSELADLILTRKSYSEKYIENMINAYPLARLSHKEAYRLAFGVFHDENEFYKRPLSKFKKDILKKLKLINI